MYSHLNTQPELQNYNPMEAIRINGKEEVNRGFNGGKEDDEEGVGRGNEVQLLCSVLSPLLVEGEGKGVGDDGSSPATVVEGDVAGEIEDERRRCRSKVIEGKS
ncbi:hypothetical protein QN277_005673 [Acacia crassicarpa]|uniref:Uncharacterized protein n=1 Tax=Acacia crassicarpa TaxID=499986 RepID=A0AAE1MGM4_9FABA|nr:hypothetical protein QN277_005673 [Acacia crassicarpa]